VVDKVDKIISESEREEKKGSSRVVTDGKGLAQGKHRVSASHDVKESKRWEGSRWHTKAVKREAIHGSDNKKEQKKGGGCKRGCRKKGNYDRT